MNSASHSSMPSIIMKTSHEPQEMTAAGTAHKHSKPKPTTYTHTEPDGTRVVKTKQRKSLPDGTTLTKVRTEMFSPASDSKDAPINHMIKTRTKRIDSGGGLSFTTTTKEEMQECPPVTRTKVLNDGSRVIQTKKITAAPVKTTTTIHLTNIPEHLSNVPTGLQEVDERQERVKEIDKMTPELLEDEEAPVPPHFIGVSYEKGLPDVQKTLQVEEIHGKMTPELLEDEEAPVPPHFIGVSYESGHPDVQKSLQVEEIHGKSAPQQEEDSVVSTSNGSKRSRFPFGRLFHSSKNSVAPMPMDRDSNVSSRRANGEPAGNEDDEEGLAVAIPIDQEPIYEAEKFHPEERTPFYKKKGYIIWTVVALVVISVIVALSVVYTTKEAVEDEPTKSEQLERDESIIMEYIQGQVLPPNITWKNISRAEPRYKALNWIVREDGLQLEKLNNRLIQRYILGLLAFSFDSKSWKSCGGEEHGTSVCQVIDEVTKESTDHIAWLSNKNECTWWGVACKRNRVIGLDLNGNSLIGEIPAEIAELDLELLSLSSNCIVGTLPPEIGTMTSLQQLDLELNGLSGTVPDLTSLAKLERLNLADQYWGVICNRSDGTVVDTSDQNQGLQGNILGPGIGQLKTLRDLSLTFNSFSGSIATEIGELESLVILRIGENLFNGTIPQEITSLTNLRELWIESTYISGEIPPGIGNLKQLESLGLHTTNLEGTIPDSVYNLTNLQALLLYDNIPGFHGSIKTNIGDLTKLTRLWINDNPLLTGTLPSELGLCDELKIFQMSNTNISGTIPPEVCNLLYYKKLYSEDYGESFKADCSPDETGTPFFSCECCNTCCDHGTQVCLIKT